MIRFNVTFSESVMRFALGFAESATQFAVKFGDIQIITTNGIPYPGDYIVIPKVTEQVLPTAKAIMEEDLTIKSIPFYNVSNTAGGSSVYIGNEV